MDTYIYTCVSDMCATRACVCVYVGESDSAQRGRVWGVCVQMEEQKEKIYTFN